MAHPNAELLRRGYEAFAEQDMETVSDLWTDDIGWHSYGESPFSGDFKGKQEVFGVLAKIPQETESFSQELHDIVANDEHAIALVSQTMTVNGQTTTFETVHIWHVNSDNKFTEAWIVPMDQAAAAKIWK